MKQKKESLLFYSILTALCGFLIFLDQWAKHNVEWFITFNQYLGTTGFFNFQKFYNAGFILHSLNEISSLTRVVFVCTLFGFIFFSYFLLHSILNPTLTRLKIGITLFFTAIASNTIDRVLNGAVTDFICVTLFSNKYIFNFADVYMWVGFGIVLYSIFKDQSKIWTPNSKRKKHFINTVYQSKWAFKLVLVTLSCSVVLILFSYTFIRHYTQQLSREDGAIFLASSIIISLILSAFTFYAGVLFSHKSAGPLYSFEKYVDGLLKGENKNFVLRSGDEHKHLVELAEKLRLEISQKNGTNKGKKNEAA